MVMLSYDIRGRGARPVLFLHGFLGSGRNLSSLARRYSEARPDARIVLPDMTGHGASGPLLKGAILADMAADVLMLADGLELPRPFSIVGHSLGGRVALQMRLIDPNAIGDITLLDIGPGPLKSHDTNIDGLVQRMLSAPDSTSSRDEMRQHFTSVGLAPALVDWLLMNLWMEKQEYMWRIDRRSLAEFHARSRGVDLWKAVEMPGVITTCIRGGSSDFVSDADAARLEKAGCSVKTIPNAGHFIHIDQPDPLLQLLVGK